jgi:hypothetical protein
MAGVWYDFNLHLIGEHDKCEALYNELGIACDGRYDDDNEIEPIKAFGPFREGAENEGDGVVIWKHPIHLQTGDDGMRGEAYTPFLPYIEKHLGVSLLFEGIADTDCSRDSFYFVFENGNITKKYYNSHDFNEYEDEEEDCIKVRDEDSKKVVEPFVKQWIKKAEKRGKYYKRELSQ